MPLPIEQDSDNNPPLSTSQGKKSTSAGVQIPTKNGRKNGTAKDTPSGGVMAAVTKNNASKRTAKHPTPSSSFQQSPDSKPVILASNGNPVTSPLLDAVSSANMAPSISQNTTEWAKNVPLPPYSSSPSNLISLGESPPTQPSSYEGRLANFGWTTREQRGIPNGHPTSASPPSNRRRPMSYHLDSNYGPVTDDQHSVPARGTRRSSMVSTYSHSRHGVQPPLPHQAQAHYYGAPDIDLLSPSVHGLVPGESGYHCGFDHLPTFRDSTKPADNVLVTGYEGALEVLTVSKRGLSKVTKIDGLRGGVYNAKIIPWHAGGGQSISFPFIAIVVHGPCWPSSESAVSSEGAPTTHAESARSSPRVAGQMNHEIEGGIVEYYQTTVEVYSLITKQHITTLLSLPKTHITAPITSPLFRPPPPVGSLTISADGGYVIITSGNTGETWIFCHSIMNKNEDRPSHSFKCIGKVWTSVQHGVAADPTGLNGHADGDWHQSEFPATRQQYKASIVSLSSRWLAYCPSAPSTQISLGATVHSLQLTAKFPGSNSHSPPQLPTVNCLVDTPGGESVIKQLAQAATQEVIKSATYLGKQGVQAWNSYWKPQSFNAGVPYQNASNLAHQFPPTHGGPSQAPAAKDPGLISILDLDYLGRHSSSANSPHPLATFKISQGCSFLSFAPSGLALFTASSKGDVQFVWDMMRIQYAKPSFLKIGSLGTGTQGPHVRQIAQFSRMTIARIIDVVWTTPHGERAAFITEPGTVHILDLPASAFTWPPPRRKLPNSHLGEEGSGPALSAASVATSAVSSLWTAARPLVRGRRSSSTGISAISAASVTSQAGHGTQALAAGISRSVGAATGRMNELRKSNSHKLHLPRGSSVPSRACISLITGKRNDSLLVVGGGLVGVYTVKSRRADLPADKQNPSKGAKYIEFRLPNLPDLKIAPEPLRSLKDWNLDLADSEHSESHLAQPSTKETISRGTESSIPQAEIESNAPYQPFHTDSRVCIYIFSHGEVMLPSPSVSALFAPSHPSGEAISSTTTKSNIPWAFGGSITSENLNVCYAQNADDSIQSLSDHRALPPSAMVRVMKFPADGEDYEQIVVTTRARRSGRSNGDLPDDGEGFFEDEMDILDFADQRV